MHLVGFFNLFLLFIIVDTENENEAQYSGQNG